MITIFGDSDIREKERVTDTERPGGYRKDELGGNARNEVLARHCREN